MDNNTPIVSEENSGSKSTIIILLGIVVAICLLVVCGAVIIFYSFRNLNPSVPITATEELIPQVPETPAYEFFDTFDDNSNQWSVGRDDNEYWSGEVTIQDGVYVWDVQEFHQDLFVSSWRTYAESPAVQDFDLTVDAKLSTPESEKLCYAVVFHASPANFATNGYEFHVCDTGHFFVGYYTAEEGKSKEFINWTESSSVQSGDWNTLTVNARGNEYTLSINNDVVFQFTDSTSPSGSVYLLVRYYESVPGTILFDNFGFQPR